MASSETQLDATLLSNPGTPYAFSTALKPPGSVSHKSNSVLELEGHGSEDTQLEVAGRLSLDSVHVGSAPQLPSNTTKALQSPNETALSDSLGILDLDAMGDSATSQFLTSPREELQLHLSLTTPARSSNGIPLSNQRRALILPAPSIPVKGVGLGLDDSQSSGEELALSAGDLEQLDVTLSDQSDHSNDAWLPREQPVSVPSPPAAHVNGTVTDTPRNPFDGSIGGMESQSCDQDSEFKALDQASFLEQLNKDEEEANKYNLTPSDSKLTSFTETPHMTDFSMGSYFREKSDKMGELSAKLSPQCRPQFNNSSHVIVSPSATSGVTSTSSAVTGLSTLGKSVNPLDVVFEGQTPAVAPPSLLPGGVPKLNLTDSSEPHPSSEQSLSSLYINKEHLTQDGLSSRYLYGNVSESSTPSHTPGDSLTLNRDSVGGLPSHYFTADCSPSATTGGSLTPGRSPLTHTISQLSAGLPSHYLQPQDSTLVFPELSALSSLPPDLSYPMATPPSAYLPLGFEVTNVSNPPSFVTADESCASHVTSGDQSAGNKAPNIAHQTLTGDDCKMSDKEEVAAANTSHVTCGESHVMEEHVSQAQLSAHISQSASLDTNAVDSALSSNSVPMDTSLTSSPPPSIGHSPTSSPPPAVGHSPTSSPPPVIGHSSADVTLASKSLTAHLFSTFTASPTPSIVTAPSMQAITTPLSPVSSTHTLSHHPVSPSTTLPPLSLTLATPHHTLHSSRISPTPVGEIPADWLEVCHSLVFRSVCCVGDSESEWMDIANRGERWLQVALSLSHLCQDGQELSSESNVFVLTQRLFVGPGSKERVKVTFSPREKGAYDGVVHICASLVVASRENSSPLATVALKASAELPNLTVECPSTHTLDFGTVIGGSTLQLPVELINSGSASLPLRVTISCEDPLHRMYFTMIGGLNGAPPSPRSHPHSLTFTLPPPPHNKPHSLRVQFSTPKLYHAEMPRPPLVIKGSLDIALDSKHVQDTITSLPIEAVVGVAKLLAPGAFQGNDFTFTCLTGHTKTERVPLKNAGNIPLTVLARMSHPALFLVSPHTLHIQPGQESYVDVTFAPTTHLATSEVTLMLRVDPSGPDYNLTLRGVAIQHSAPEETISRTKTLSDTKREDKVFPDTTSEGHRTKNVSGWLSHVPHSLASHCSPPPQRTPSPQHPQSSHPTPAPRHPHSSHRTPAPQQPRSSRRTPSPRHSHQAPKSPPRRSVYIREEEVVFPPTPLHTRSTLKVQVCNRDVPLAKFSVIKPTPPFSVDHHTFKLGSRQCARLPIHFTPTAVGKFEGIVALRTDLKHQTFVVVRGEVPDS